MGLGRVRVAGFTTLGRVLAIRSTTVDLVSDQLHSIATIATGGVADAISGLGSLVALWAV